MKSKHVDAMLRQKCISALVTVYSQLRLLPSSYLISGGLKTRHDKPLVLGMYADIWKGKCDSRTVAIKIFRSSRSRDSVAIRKVLHTSQNKSLVLTTSFKRIFEQAVTRKQLSHVNIVPFLGISNTSPPCMISEWMIHGQLVEYLSLNPDADRLLLVS